MTYNAVHVMSGADVPFKGGTGHRTADIRRQFFIVDDQERDVHFRGAYEIAAMRSSPPHRHTFDQVRYQTAGEQRYGDQEWRPGTLGYFPESVFYGPHTSSEGGFAEVDIQLPGPSRGLFGSNDDLIRAMSALRETGVQFSDGQAIHPDGRSQDATEACWEYLLGGEVQYAPARFDAPVVVDTTSFAWVAVGEGIAQRRIACFNESGPSISMLRLEPGSETGGGVSPCAQVRFVVEGEVEYDRVSCPGVSCLYYPPGVEYAPLRSKGETTLLLIGFQAPGGAKPPLDLE